MAINPYTVTAIRLENNDYKFEIISTGYVYGTNGQRIPRSIKEVDITIDGRGFNAANMINTMKSVNIDVDSDAKAADVRQLWNNRMVPLLQRAIDELE